jgi:glycosyltransferase involved in cell wall biosynthesis
MTFCIITHVNHGKQHEKYYAYLPYVKEMNIWLKYVDNVIVIAPLTLNEKDAISLEYHHSNIDFRIIPEFNLISIVSKCKTLIALPNILYAIYKAMKQSDHIHLRCPGNMGLLGAIVQILFPNKPKTAKYAGNWDHNAKQPITYKLQKWIISNTFLTKNMKVLVYGEWENSTHNVKPFFTASYYENEKLDCSPRPLKEKISFLFVGTLSNGKQPLYAVKMVEQLYKIGHNVQLTLYGEGNERKLLESYISENNLDKIVFLKGNQNQETLKQAYLANHFVVLPSLSEGWPKVVAEAMFWGCLPIASSVSCVPNMLDKGKRGMLLEMNLDKDVKQIEALLTDENDFKNKISKAITWSRNYTLDVFEEEIKKMVQA